MIILRPLVTLLQGEQVNNSSLKIEKYILILIFILPLINTFFKFSEQIQIWKIFLGIKPVEIKFRVYEI